MKRLALYLAALGLVGMIFGWWGLETVSGRRNFDEMAGMIPFFTGIASVLLVIAAIALWCRAAWRARAKNK